MAKPTTEQLAKINQKALVPLTEDQTHVFQAKIIGTKRIEKYKMKITPNFLRKMADQVKEGVALLIDHPWMKWEAMSFPYGRTFDSRIVEEGGELELYGDHYMVKGQEVCGISTDQLATGIDSGTIFDTSAGFISTKHICNICGGDYYRSENCHHIRGQMYDGKECLVMADDGYIMENSIVFDGGYEGAGFKQSVLSANASKEMEHQPIEYEPLPLDAKSLNGDERVFYFFSNKGGVSAYVPKQQKNEQAKALAEGDESSMDGKEQAVQLQQAQAALNQATGLLGQIRAALGVDADTGILSKITALSAQAQVGEQYKSQLIESTCGAGVRALGEAFNVEAMKLSLAHLPVAEIQKVNATYEAQAKAALGGGGRHTQGGDIDLPANALNGDPANPQANGGQKTTEQLQTEAAAEARAAMQRTGNSHLMKEVK